MKTQRNGGGSGRDSGGDDSDSGNSGGSASTGSGSSGIRHEEKAVARFTDLHTDSTPEDMRKLFSGVGRIKEFSMLHDNNGNFMGEAEVEYERNSNAHKAVRKLHNKDFKGKPLTVTIVEVFGNQKGSSRTNYNPTATSPAYFESEPETSKGKGEKRKNSSDEEEDDPRGIKIG